MKKKIFIIPLLCLLILSGGCDKDTKSEKTYCYPSDVLDYDVKSYDTDIFYVVKYISFDEQYINLLVYNWSPHIYTPQEWESLEDKPVSIDDKDYYDSIYHHQVANNGDYFLYICQRKSLNDYYVFEEIIINDIYKSYDSIDVKSPTYNFYQGDFLFLEDKNQFENRVAEIRLKYKLKSKFTSKFDGAISFNLVVTYTDPYVGLEISFSPY